MIHESHYEFAYLPANSLTLKQVREIYNLKQVDVAKILDCTQSRISKIDSKSIDLNHLVAIAESRGHKVHISLVQIIRAEISK